MPKPNKGNDGGTINADSDPDGVSAALGLEDAVDDDEQGDGPDDGQDPEGDEPEDGEDELTLADLADQLAEQRRTIASLKRELAARRVAGKDKPKGETTGSTDDGETVEQAVARGREEARLEYGAQLAEASIKAALTGIIPETDLDDFVNDLRLDRYVDEDGKPDAAAIKALRDRQAKITRRRPGARNVGHARQGNGTGDKSKGEKFADALTAAGF